MDSPAAFDPDEEIYKKNNTIPAANVPEQKTIIVESKTGRNATYLAEKKLELDPADLANTVTIQAGTKGHDKFVNHIASNLKAGTTVQISQAALEYLAKFSKKMKDGYQAAVPLICLGADGCPYARSCPLLKAGLEVPLMEACPVEEHLFNTWVEDKMLELDVDPDDPMASIDRSQIREYAELEILQLRATLEMADDPTTVREKVVGVNEQGEPLVQDVENPRIGIISKLAQAKRGLLGDLVGTRKERIKAGPRGESAGNAIAAMAAGARKKNDELEKKRLESATNEKEVIVVDVTPPKE